MFRANGPAIQILIDGIHANGWAVGPHGKWGLIDLARRFAVGQAMRTNGPLARNRSVKAEVAARQVILIFGDGGKLRDEFPIDVEGLFVRGPRGGRFTEMLQ